MPIVPVFFGIVIRLYYRDHNPPHFHVEYGDQEAFVEIRTGKVLAGGLPPRVMRLVNEWRLGRRSEIENAWKAVQADRMPKRIAPLE